MRLPSNSTPDRNNTQDKQDIGFEKEKTAYLVGEKNK